MLVSLTYGTNIKDNSTLVLMHSDIVNGHQLLCDAHTMLEPHRGTAALFLTILSFSAFFFLCVCLFESLFFGASIVYFNNLMRTADLILCLPDRISVCTHP